MLQYSVIIRHDGRCNNEIGRLFMCNYLIILILIDSTHRTTHSTRLAKTKKPLKNNEICAILIKEEGEKWKII